eukprot:TRINITY_DN3817_c0_g1_i1.p1 TRINITY_DN3817_c0_g1~~TRINITY_DN3817_c0_g1_i1.p1  ORF type:complete len:507 (+),score=135.42 TRINITY_DN3817_c0_g1_i1:2107-3627(+)
MTSARRRLVLLIALSVVSFCFGACPQHFASEFAVEDIVSSSSARSAYVQCLLQWEAAFFSAGLGLDATTGLTHDGFIFDLTTGNVSSVHEFSAASKEALHIPILVMAIAGNPLAAELLSQSAACDGCNTTAFAVQLLSSKMDAYEDFDSRLPGFGGFLPWFTISNGHILPTWDWTSTVPSLDNGEWIWTLYAASKVLASNGFTELAARYEQRLRLQQANAKLVFYAGDGLVRAVTSIVNTSAQPSPDNYKQSGPPDFLDDPYEGELFTVFLDLFGQGFTDTDREQMWAIKLANLQPVNFSAAAVGPITVQRGWWYSAHENWKVLELPYYDIPLVAEVFINGEKARTWNSVSSSLPGLRASTNDPFIQYVSNNGISSIAFQPSTARSLVTPYGAFPLLIANASVGLAWHLYTLQNNRSMQTAYGTAECFDNDLKLVAPIVTWDTKMTSMCAILGSLASPSLVDLNRAFLKQDGVYERFLSVIQAQYSQKFPLVVGSELPFGLPPTVR